MTESTGVTSEVEAPSSTPPRGRGIKLFLGSDAPDLYETGTMAPATFPADDAQAMVEQQIDISTSSVGTVTRVPFRGEGDEGYSLVDAWFGPGFVLPRHSHNADCLYYITEGSVTMGARTLKSGDGFFVPAGAPYAYEAGPEGVRILEFRLRTSFDMVIPSGQVDRYRRLAEVSSSNAETWAEQQRQFLEAASA